MTLGEAQALGFAEANPAQDIEGLDARAKLAILAMVALGVQAPTCAIPAAPCGADRAGVRPAQPALVRLEACLAREV